MQRAWTRPAELAAAMRKRADSGRNVVLSPATAKLIADVLQREERPLLRDHVDPFSEGSAIYRLNDKGDIAELVAFARSALVARAAFDYLCERFPDVSYMQKRRAWVEADRITTGPDQKAREER